MSSYHIVKPTGGVRMRHVMDPSDPNVNHSLPGYGPVVSVNRAVRTRLLRGVVWGLGEKDPRLPRLENDITLPLTKFQIFLLKMLNHLNQGTTF